MAADRHGDAPPSAWVVRWAPLVAPEADVVDIAAGRGRHARYFARRGCRVVAVDRDADALAALADAGGVRTVVADLEGGPWPLAAATADAVIVTNYLHRPLFPHLVTLLKAGGVLIYETFMVGNERHGRPSNPDFLLRPDELLDAFRASLHIVAFEQGELERPQPAVVQRLCAVAGAAPRTLLP